MATTNSGHSESLSATGRFLVLACLALSHNLGLAGDASDASVETLARAERLLAEAAGRWPQASNNPAAAWQLGRACFDVADAATNNARRAEASRQGIAASRQAIALDPKSAPAYYYLGLNLGQLARTRPLAAVGMLGDIETAWTKAIALDPKFDFAGPHRSIGVLYRDAPGWPVSLGSRKKALQHLEKAVALSPEYPDNRLCLFEAWLGWGKQEKARASLDDTRKALKAAREKLTGEDWTASWRDWDSRWKRLTDQLHVAGDPVP